MPNLNKPAKELFVDLINSTSKRANDAWQDVDYAAISVGAPVAVPRTLGNGYKNTYVNVYDATDVGLTAPYRLNYDRIDLKDLTRRYENALTFYLSEDTQSVVPSELLAALNLAAGTAMVAGDLSSTPFAVTSWPIVMPLEAAETSLIYCGVGKIHLSTPLEHALLPYVGEMSALGVKLLGDLDDIESLPAGLGYVQTYALPAFSRMTEYVEYYSGPGATHSQVRLYSRYATISQALVVEAISTVHLNPASRKNFLGGAENYVGKVVQIEDELCLVTDVVLGGGGSTDIASLIVKRGLDDTIPTEHAIGSTLYMIREDGPKGLMAVTNAASVNAKCLAKIGPDTEEPNSVDYINVVFHNRLGRPYPPRNAKVNGRWDSAIQGAGRDYTVTWEHHPRYDADANRIADTLGWFEHGFYETTEDDVEYQITVRMVDGDSVLYTSPLVTGTSHTFTMPDFDGEVYLEVTSQIAGVACLTPPTVYFMSEEGAEFAPSLGVLTLLPTDTEVVLDIEMNTPGYPVAVGYSADGNDYPYTIDWEVDESGVFTSFATNTRTIVFADYPAHAEKDIRATVTMTNSEGADTKTSATFTLPAAS